jgi:HPt (histidine-containing phosphotransfer) domain-containing protein/ferredoxin
MKIRSQVGMVLNLDKCIGCHTCSVTCKNVWTSREGTEYAWFNNVETKPGTGIKERHTFGADHRDIALNALFGPCFHIRQLPDMTGLDISRELTRRYASDELPPLVALTANVLKDKKEYLDAGMDDVLSKPLSVPALTAMIKKFWDTCDEEESTMTKVDTDKAQTLLDITMLEQYIELVGPKLITDGLAVFEKMMPGYLAVLESNLTARDQKGIVEEGHKIKGAAGSVGLRHLQQLGQQIQSPDLPAWSDNVG